MTMKPHPAAARFPMLSTDRYVSLRESIRAHGLRHPIVICDGMVLDGRNRMKACDELGIEPKIEAFDGDPYQYAWDTNGERRDLSADQRYLIWKHQMQDSVTWQAEQAKRQVDANRARSEAAQARPRNGDGTLASAATTCGTTGQPDRTSTAKAVASKTNRGAVERMDRLDRERPDLAVKVVAGEMKPGQALREMKRAQVAEKVAALPEGKHRVIYADPPWKYGDEREGFAGEYTAAATHYPTMPVADIAALDVCSLAADDSVLFLWSTFPLLPDALQVAKAWGFAYKTSFVWDKDAWNVGNYHDACAELLIVATRGSCLPVKGEEPDDEAFRRDSGNWRGPRPSQVQRHPRLKHSEKPGHFRALIDAMYPEGPRIELFARGRLPSGWAAWGNEAQ